MALGLFGVMGCMAAGAIVICMLWYGILHGCIDGLTRLTRSGLSMVTRINHML
jgi:hypothetical protein